MSGNRPRRVAIVGGGITGLAAAHRLAHVDDPPAVTVLEAAPLLGGKIRTGDLLGLPVETGPDTILARVPWGLALLRELGLGDRLVSPATGSAQVWARGRLRPLPDGLVLGVPGRVGPLLRSGVLGPGALARAAAEPLLPRRFGRRTADPTVAELVGGRFGRGVFERLVDPLVSGINAGRGDRLSLRATAPDVAAVADANRSLLLGLGRRPAPAAGPVFVSVPGGLSTLVDTLADDLRRAGVDVRTGATVTSLTDLDADAVVLAAPAPTAAALLAPLSADAAAGLRSVTYSSVAVATLAYDERDVARPLDGAGFLVPRREGWLLTAGTYVSTKWPALRPPGRVLVRASTGRAGDVRFASMDDDELVERLHAEVARATGIAAPPVEWRVDRWYDAFPQYDAGHLDRVASIERAVVRDAPHVRLAGAAYRGVGIASCIRQARDAADALLTGEL